jgi:uncharacterized protein YwqG
MRAFGKLFVCVSVAAVSFNMTVATEPPPFQPGGFGFGQKKGQDPFALVQNPQVKGELKMTDQQAEKLPAAAMKALAEVLDATQLKRLKQIYLQTRGNAVYLEADVKKELKITDDQAKKIQGAIDKLTKDQQEMLQGGFDPDTFTKIQELQKSTDDAVLATLTADQKSTWTKMIGEKFEMKGFGGGFGKGGKKGGD